MNIIIVGAGKVGQTLCSELAEHHNILIIEKNGELINKLMDKYDITGVVGSGTDIDVLNEAGIKTADMLVAATQLDEVNIMACTMAKKSGVANTVARVRNPEYVRHGDFMKSAFGISLIINPELSTALDIARALRYESALSVQPLAGNRVSLVEIEVKQHSVLDELSLSEFRRRYGTVLVCIIERDGKSFIPSGSDTLHVGDKIFVAGLPKDMTAFHRKIGSKEKSVRSSLIVGGGKIAHYLLTLLEHTAIEIKVIECNEERCEMLSFEHPNVRVICADGTDPEVLEEQGVTDYDSLVSLTGVDEENLIVSIFAAKKGVRKVITKMSRTNILNIIDTKELKKVVSPKYLVASEIARFVRSRDNAKGSNVEALYRVADNQVEVLQFKVGEKCPILNITLANMTFKSDLLIAYILRNGKIIFPNGQDTFKVDDRIIVITTHKEFSDLEDILEK